MKKLLTSLIVAAFVVGSAGIATAADSGLWTKGFMNVTLQYLSHPSFHSSSDKQRGSKNMFGGRQRTRMVLEYVKDENLSATLQFEINQGWGYTRLFNTGDYSGGRVNSDGVNIATKHAYLDWIVPDTELMVRMGVQPLALPWALPGGNSVLNADAAGITLSYQFNDWIGANLFWGRLWDDATFGDHATWGYNGGDDWDAFGLVVPLTFEGISATPYVVYSRMGYNVRDYYYDGYEVPGGTTGRGYNGWWGGLSGSLTMFDPFFVNLDALYGSLTNNSSNGSNHGWFTGLQIGYKFDFVTPSLVGFYSSGKRSNSHDSRTPLISGDNGYFGPTTYGTDGDFQIGRSMAFTDGFNGIWGVGLKLSDITFIEKLYHTINFFFYGGTSKKEQANDLAWDPVTGIMTSKDYAWEINLENKYNIYENLIAVLELSYLKANFDDAIGGRSNNYMDKGSFKGALQIQYNF